MEEASPATYRVGDLVEVQTSFVVFPVKEGKFKMSLILRSIALLDHSETDVSEHIYIISKAPLLTETIHTDSASFCQ